MTFWIDIAKGVLIGVLAGVPTFIVGFYVSMKYLVPKMTTDTAISTADALVKHPKVKPWIDKAQEFVEKLDPLIDKAKEVDLQEIVDLAKGLKVFIEVQNKTQPPPPPKKKE